MPKGYSWRRPQILEMHATLVEVPEGEDVIEYLTNTAEEVGYMPLIVLSGVGMLSRAVLNVPNDEALPEILERTDTFGIERNPDDEAIRKFNTYKHVKADDLPEEDLAELSKMLENHKGIESKPHWASIQTFDYPLRLIYAHGGKYRQSSIENYHFILSGSPDRPLGIADSFVGQVLPGCIAKSPLQFVIGVKPSLSDVNVQGRTLSIEPGYEVLETLHKFKNRYYLGKCFVFSISGKICEADLENITKTGEKDVFHIPYREDGYMFDGMSGIIGTELDEQILNAAIMIPTEDTPFDCMGGRLMRAIVANEGPVDLYIGEMIPECDITEERL